MPSILNPRRAFIGAAFLVASLLPFVARAQSAAGDVHLTLNGAPAVAGDNVTTDVKSLVVENGLLKITFGRDVKNDFSATSVIKNGVELGHNLTGVKGPDRSFYVDYNAGRGHLVAYIVRIVKNTPDLAHFAVIDTSPLHLEHHFVMLRGESGIHPWVLIDTRNAGGAGGGEMRSMYKFDMNIMDWAWTPERTGKQPSYATLQAISPLGNAGDETWKLPANSPYIQYDGPVYQKYDYSLYFSEAPMWGHYGHGFGGWFIPSDRASYAGGPLRQELAVHQDALLLNYIGGGHYGGGGSAAGLNGLKIHGPWYVYINAADTPEALIADAKKTAEAENKKIPYAFVDNEELYPTHRTNVTGQLKISHDRSAAGAYVILGKPSNRARGGGGARAGAAASAATSATVSSASLATRGTGARGARAGRGARGPEGGSGAVVDRASILYTQSGDFIYYVKADADGKFTIPAVRPGDYTLYAWQTQGPITQSLAKDDIAVKGDALDLGPVAWDPPYHPNLIWQIGKADRLAGEFKYGGSPRTNQYVINEPADLTFTVGKSKESEDWLYAQKTGTWTVNFNVEKVPAGNAYLTVAIAGGTATVAADINGTQVGSWSYADEGSVRRAANRSGRYARNEYSFPASVLKQGENTMTLKAAGSGLEYDTMVLESD